MPGDWGGGAGAGIPQTLAELGRIRAQGQLENAGIWGQSLGNIGNLIASAPQRQLQQQELQARTSELQGLAQDRQLKVQQAQQAQAGAQALAQALQDPANANDPEKVYQAVAKQFPGQAQAYLDLATKHQEALDKLTSAKNAQHQSFADILSAIDPSNPQEMTAAIALAHARGLPSDMLQAFASGADEDPVKATKLFVDSAPENVKAARARAEKAAEEAAKVTVGHPGDVLFQNGAQVGTVPEKTPTAPRPVEVHTMEGGKPVTKFLPPDQATGQTFEAQPPASVIYPPAAGAAGASDLTPEGVDYAATQYRVTGQMPSLGMGKTPARAQIINKAAEQARLLGQTPAAAIQKQAAFKADSNALKQMQTLSAGAEASENKAIGQIGLIKDLSAKVDRTQYPIINGALQAGKINVIGDSNAKQLANAIQTFSNEYGKIIEGSTASVAGSSDSSRRASAKLVDAALNKKTLDDVLTLMQKEMDLTLGGYGAAIGHITTRMGGSSTPAGAGTNPADPLGILGK